MFQYFGVNFPSQNQPCCPAVNPSSIIIMDMLYTNILEYITMAMATKGLQASIYIAECGIGRGEGRPW